MVAGIVVSVSMGVMNPLLAKLTTLMSDKYKMLKGLRKEVSFLRDELTTINALLEKMDKADELDSLARNWRKHVIEMSYDIEDCIDDFIQHVGEADDNKVGILRKASQYLRGFKDHNRVANQIKEIKTRVIQASERRLRYKLDDCISNTTTVLIDPRLSALYKEASSLVGIDNQKKDLVNWVMDHDQQLKMASIVGSGGLGKTTLANQVYHEVRGQFNCKAFVSISQNPDMIRVLNSVILQVGLLRLSHAYEVQDLINILREYLQDKRYLIIVDDLWDVRVWITLRCVFPQNNHHSRVIVTTRITEVAWVCGKDYGCVHNMKPLSEADSRKLFFNRIFGTKGSCPSQFTEVSSEILKKCGGLPLAIITVASILASQPTKVKEQWEYIKNSLSVVAEDSTLEDMMHILDLSYKNLPRHLKACFLYLGIYPEDWEIGKSDLVRQWVAGGFVANSLGRNVWDVGNSYFNELINRSMIQPAYDDLDINVQSCKVHDMVRDLIVRRCNEDNFLRVVHDLQAVAEMQDKVRRLSLDLSFREDEALPIVTTDYLSHVRSLAIFGGSQHMPSLLEFKFIRLLFLDFSKLVTTINLTSVSQLSQLKYLKVRCNRWFPGFPKLSIVLPSPICKLRYLETLELPSTSSCSIPKDITDLPRLSHLVLPLGTRLPDGIGKLRSSLRTLRGFSLPKSLLQNTKDISELTNLEELALINSREVYWNTMLVCADEDDTAESTWMAALSSCLGKLSNLKRLFMESYSETLCGDALSSFSPPFHSLEYLDLSGWTFSKVPNWIGDLQNLSRLELTSNSTCREDVAIIGMLPSLVELTMRIQGVPKENIVIGSTGFSIVKHLLFDCDALSYLTFGVGAMSKLWKLTLGLDEDEWDKATPLGLENLLSLKQIEVMRTKYFDIAVPLDKKAKEKDKISQAKKDKIKGVFQDAADAHPCHPAFILYKGCLRRPRR